MSFTDLPQASWVELLRYVEETLKSGRYNDPKCLTRSGRKIYSQNDEDGIIAEIFARIGTTNKTFLEFGVEGGIECNTLWLLINGWRGVWIEADEHFAERISQSHGHWIASKQLQTVRSMVDAENINDLISQSGLPSEIDFLSIDIDLNDYWVWKAIEATSPRVVCIEYNATWPPPAAITVKYYPQATWSRTNHFGASLGALAALGEQKGYRLVGCNLSGANAFFVRADLCKDLFYKPGCVATHYEPARYFLAYLPSGHPSGVAELVDVTT